VERSPLYFLIDAATKYETTFSKKVGSYLPLKAKIPNKKANKQVFIF
jgi:hypothetical protein